MSVRGAVVTVALSSGLLMFGCGANDLGSPGDEFLGYALTLVAPDSVGQGEMIAVRVTGFTGCCCDRFERIEVENVGTRWVLRPIGRHWKASAGTGCTRLMKYFDRTVLLEALGLGWTYVEVQSTGPILVDSTYVGE